MKTTTTAALATAAAQASSCNKAMMKMVVHERASEE
jgi:hypothetical protein